MAYTAVPTVSTGDAWTAANHNGYIRNNFAASAPDLFTTKGDMIVAEGADTASRLGVGTNKQTLIADSAEALGMKWGDPSDLITFGSYTHVDFSGDDIYNTPGTFFQNITASTGFNAPAGIRVALMRASITWESAGSTQDYIFFGSSGDTNNEFLKFYRYGDTNYKVTKTGMLFIEGNRFQYTLSDSADAIIELEIFGYI